MQEDFQSDRAFHVLTKSASCPMASGHVRPYHNMRSKASFDPNMLGGTSVGSSAGSVKDGGTSSCMDELSFAKYRTGLRGDDVLTNTGVETFQNTYYNYQPFRAPHAGSTIGLSVAAPVYNSPQNLSKNNFANNPIQWT